MWEDVSGATCTTFTCLADQVPAVPAEVTAILTAMAAISNCKLVGLVYQNAEANAGSLTSGAYASVADRAVFKLRYQDSRQVGRIEVPAPRDVIFLPDNATVDMDQPQVAAFVAALIANAGNHGGNPVISVDTGKRQMVNRGPF